MFMFFVFPPLPACLGGWIKKKSGKVCFAISFIVLLALASIKEVQEQWTLGIYVATAVPNSFCNRDCISLLDTGSEKSKRQMGFLHHPQNSQELHTWADLKLFPVRRQLKWERGTMLSGPVTGMWQRAEPPRAASRPVLAPLVTCTISSCQFLSRAVDIIH